MCGPIGGARQDLLAALIARSAGGPYDPDKPAPALSDFIVEWDAEVRRKAEEARRKAEEDSYG